MTDIVSLRNWQLLVWLGVYDHEQQHPRPVTVNLDLWVDTRAAGLSDNVADTVDYDALARHITDAVSNQRFLLIERLAAVMAAECLQIPKVQRVRVRVIKPNALPNADSVVTVIRKRGWDLLERG